MTARWRATKRLELPTLHPKSAALRSSHWAGELLASVAVNGRASGVRTRPSASRHSLCRLRVKTRPVPPMLATLDFRCSVSNRGRAAAQYVAKGHTGASAQNLRTISAKLDFQTGPQLLTSRRPFANVNVGCLPTSYQQNWGRFRKNRAPHWEVDGNGQV